jgi:hypothetical protein
MDFINMLNEIREDNVTKKTIETLKARMVPLPQHIKPTILYAKNKSVNEENRRELKKIPRPERVFTHEHNEKELQTVFPKYSGKACIHCHFSVNQSSCYMMN